VKIGRLSNGRWSVTGFVDAQNAFGAQLRQTFDCQISYSGNTAVLHVLRIGDQTLINE
jgi:hypothetical protein